MDGKEIVAIMGYNAAGKSTLVEQFVRDGYHRINRDENGGSIPEQVGFARDAIKAGNERVVLDNTYPTIQSRQGLVDLGKELGIPTRCVWLQTSFEDAQINACLRQIKMTGDIIMPDDKHDSPNLFGIGAMFRYKSLFENKGKKNKKTGDTDYPCGAPGKQDPTKAHGWDCVDKVPFNRVWPSDYTNAALFLDADDTVRRSTGKEAWPLDPSEVEIIDGCEKRITEWLQQNNTDVVEYISNQSTHEKKEYKTPLSVIDACFDETNRQLGLDIPYNYCPHYRFPPACYCRKPQVGLGVRLIVKHKLDPAKVLYVGDSTSDKTFANRCGFQFMASDKKVAAKLKVESFFDR